MALLCAAICLSAAPFTFGVTYIVNTDSVFPDVTDPLCTPAHCTIREAINDANNSPTDDVVEFDPAVFGIPRTILLDTGTQIHILGGGTLTINGPGAALLTISGNNAKRIFATSNGAVVVINDLTLSDGDGGPSGGAIYNDGDLTLNNVVLTNNIAQLGGALQNARGLVEINDCTFNGNTAIRIGGAISNEPLVLATPGEIRIMNSRITGNNINNPCAVCVGGGIFNRGDMSIENTTISGNTAVLSGGGIHDVGNTNTIINSTISGNTAGTTGGGIHAGGNSVYMRSVTVADNTSSGSGGGIHYAGQIDVVTAQNTIIADNTDLTGTANDFGGMLVSAGYNLLEDANGAVISGITTGNILGVDPLLGPLQNNGGTTETHELLNGSPAVDAADPAFFPPTDQRGAIRPVDGDSNGVADPDIGAFEGGGVIPPTSRVLFDFDGDGKADMGIFRPAPGEWWILRSSDGGSNAYQFGQSTDTIVPADFTGDGKTDVAFFRDSIGEWFVLRSEDLSFYSFPFGAPGDVPVPADYDGDGIADPAVFRPSTGTWIILRSSDSQVDFVAFGAGSDIPLVGDYDNDGMSDIAIYRPGVAEYWILRSSLGIIAYQFGQAGDQAITADFTGDGTSDVAFFRPSTGEWYVLRSDDLTYFSFTWGTNGDIPAPGDYDGDGTADPTVFRPSTQTWYSFQSTAGVQFVPYGATGDMPIPNAYVAD